MIIPIGKRIRIIKKPPRPYKIGDEGVILDGYSTVIGPSWVNGVLKDDAIETVYMQLLMDRTGEKVSTVYAPHLFEILEEPCHSTRCCEADEMEE